jgi:hypothetical protein
MTVGDWNDIFSPNVKSSNDTVHGCCPYHSSQFGKILKFSPKVIISQRLSARVFVITPSVRQMLFSDHSVKVVSSPICVMALSNGF